MAIPLPTILNYGASALLNLARRSRSVGTPEAVLSARGVFYRVELYPSMGSPMYSIDELNRIPPPTVPYPKADAVFYTSDPTATSGQVDYFTESNNRAVDAYIDYTKTSAVFSNAPVLITGIQLIQSDVVSAVPCLDNFKVFYTFGQNFGQVAITGEMLLGPHGEFQQAGISHLTSFFAKWRVSQSGKAIKLSVVNKTFLVYLTSLQLGVINPEFHILPFTLTGVLIDPENEKTGTLNQASTVSNNRDNLPALLRAMRAYPGPDLEVAPTAGSDVTESDQKAGIAAKGILPAYDITLIYDDPATKEKMVISRTIGKAVKWSDYTNIEAPGTTRAQQQARLNALKGTAAPSSKGLTDNQINKKYETPQAALISQIPKEKLAPATAIQAEEERLKNAGSTGSLWEFQWISADD